MGEVKLSFVPINDRPMLTVVLDVPHYLATGEWGLPPNAAGAVVRVKGEATESEAEQLGAGGQHLIKAIVQQLRDAGVHKIIGPQLKVVRERRARSELTTDVDPRKALDDFLDARDVDAELRPLVIEQAERVMAGGD